jgi:hypothetical protein
MSRPDQPETIPTTPRHDELQTIHKTPMSR